MIKKLSILLISITFCLSAQAQFKKISGSEQVISDDQKEIHFPSNQVNTKSIYKDFTPPNLGVLQGKGSYFKVLSRNVYNLPTWIEGELEDQKADRGMYIRQLGINLSLHNSELELREVSQIIESGAEHFRYQQYFNGIEVYGASMVLHQEQGVLAKANGLIYPTPSIQLEERNISIEQAENLVKEQLLSEGKWNDISADKLFLVGGKQMNSRLVIYHLDQNPAAETLCYLMEVHPSISQAWNYFVDANSAEVIKAYKTSCQFKMSEELSHSCSGNHSHSNHEIGDEIAPPDGPTTANAIDLLGISRSINTYDVAGDFFLIDASRTMFDAARSSLPNDPVGAIWTIDGNNTSPFTDNFSASHVSSTNNSWNDRASVSAHHNAGKAYEYFKNSFARESINGSGGNIISVINVVDQSNQDMDNAFWNGQAMFYGNGDQVFSELAAGLDVAGHEMSHGVVQTTANLEYIGQSGAMNESFADIFGAMIDRDDWQMGEDIVIAQYPSGALRDLSNPNQGLGGPADINRGWQPDHMDEYVQLDNTPEQDNGGVHINSGITNKAFFNYATAIGKSKAEQVFYRALRVYLTKSSQFADLRIAVVASAKDIHGDGSTEFVAAQNAFTAVGIGSGGGSDPEEDLDTNPGDEYVICTDLSNNTLYILNETTGEFFANPIMVDGSEVIGPLSKPSVTDDGSNVVYVANDKTVRLLSINYATGAVVMTILGADPVWRSAVISKDGARIAALTEDLSNEILIFDFSTGTQLVESFELINPTFSEDPNVSTGNVDYADAMEFDPSGEFLMYDAQSTIESDFGSDISYWDIGFIEVWDTDAENFASGRIEKLFSQLPENTSIGNPTFSKNSPFIIAFDFYDGNDDSYALLGANTETTDVGTIFENTQLSFGSYSVDDTEILYDVSDAIDRIELADNKIQGTGNPDTYISGARWGTWYADGDRNLNVATEEIAKLTDISLLPNPVAGKLLVRFDQMRSIEKMYLSDMLGKVVWLEQPAQSIVDQLSLDFSSLQSGAYILFIETEEGQYTEKIIKE